MMYNATIHACRSSLCMPHSFSHLHSSIHQSQPCFSVSPCSWNELPASVTILQVSYYPSLLSCGDVPLWTKEPPIHRVFFLFSHAIHGSFHPFNGLDSSVPLIANLIFPSLKTWSVSPLDGVWHTSKRPNLQFNIWGCWGTIAWVFMSTHYIYLVLQCSLWEWNSRWRVMKQQVCERKDDFIYGNHLRLTWGYFFVLL